MSSLNGAGDLAERVEGNLPYLRRYARALTGCQETGDRYAAITLEALLEDTSIFERASSSRVALFHVFNGIWMSSGAPVDRKGRGDRGTTPEERAQWRLSQLTPNTREALLLHSIEGFSTAQIGEIMEIPAEEARKLIDIARAEMAQHVTGNVLVIEDEAIIAMDVASIVRETGHSVTGIARTRDQAVDLGRETPPDLILADIQLADRSSGIDAVNDILAEFGDRPVIFITAFPERLLTGDRPEPAFLIPKPYGEDQVRSAVGQAMFFAGTETLVADA